MWVSLSEGNVFVCCLVLLSFCFLLLFCCCFVFTFIFNLIFFSVAILVCVGFGPGFSSSGLDFGLRSLRLSPCGFHIQLSITYIYGIYELKDGPVMRFILRLGTRICIPLRRHGTYTHSIVRVRMGEG